MPRHDELQALRKELNETVRGGDIGAEASRRYAKLLGIPQQLVEAVLDYTGSAHATVNAALRGGVLHKSLPCIQDLYQRLDRTLDALPSVHGKVYRGTTLPPSVVEEMKHAKTFSDPGFMSTSINPDEAPRHLRSFDERSSDVRALLNIASSSGRYIADISSHPGEGEVLFRPGSSFRVEKMVWDDKEKLYVVDLVEQDPRTQHYYP